MTDPEAEPAPPPAVPVPASSAEEPTVGTGSVFAVGCTVATLVVILVGIGLFVLLRVL